MGNILIREKLSSFASHCNISPQLISLVRLVHVGRNIYLEAEMLNATNIYDKKKTCLWIKFFLGNVLI